MPNINTEPQSLEVIFKKLNKVYPDLALHIALSGLSLNKEKMYDQIDCILAVATIREISKIKPAINNPDSSNKI